ncbi:MAG: transposase [Acidobacteria bacterium]|nr:MAG: transposase [Acidobacteriota bacterium]
MPYYRRRRSAGGTFFFTVVSWQRRPWLCEEISRTVLRESIERVRRDLPFEIDAWVLLPEHLHCLWTLPENDDDYPTRWKEIKKHVTRDVRMRPLLPWVIEDPGLSRRRKREARVWQRRSWEHEIRDEHDFSNHLAYIHFNPVKHGLCSDPSAWPYSSYHRYQAIGLEELARAAAQLNDCPDVD